MRIYLNATQRNQTLCTENTEKSYGCRLDVNLTVNIRGFDRYDVLLHLSLISF